MWDGIWSLRLITKTRNKPVNNEHNNNEPSKSAEELTEKELEGVVGGGGLYLDGGAEDQVVRIDGIETRILGGQ